NREGVTVLVITHAMNLVAEYTRRTVALCEGRVLIEGETREVFGNVDLLFHTFVQPPQITLLGERLGFNPPVLSVHEAETNILERLGMSSRARRPVPR
ncbi:ABC transporter, partial [Candidatus Bathyarchaeota archaeon]|nr:ABC transporter [Candidatus Bathyarchaeota archaeon]